MNRPVNAAARLDRLPIGPFHWRVLRLVGAGMFFDSFDNSMMAGVLAALVGSGWSNMALNARFISATFLGLTIGAALAGWAGDRLGRRFAYQFNLLLFGVMCLFASVAPSMDWLIAIRCLMGVGLGAEFVVGYGMMAEFVPPANRGRFTTMLNVISSSGTFAVALVGLVVIPMAGWRAMFVIGGCGALWVWWLRRKLPESPRWLESVGRTAEAEDTLRAIEQEASTNGPLPRVVVGSVPSQQRVPITVLFTRPVIRRTLLAVAVNVTCLVGSYSFTAWIPSFFVREGLSVTRSLGFATAMMAGTIAGPLIGVLIADRIGRRHGIMATGLACSCIGAIYPFLTAPVAIMFCGFLLVSCMSLFLALGLGGYTPELFPTAYRFRGTGLAQMVGRGGLIGTPYVVLALFSNYGIAGVVAMIATLYFSLVVVVAVAGIETNQKSLEDLAPGQPAPPQPLAAPSDAIR
jgi:MFS transporter, putative metabolite:H+ symporter